MNKLYFGDNLDILKSLNKENPKGFIDLIYIDPPFNSQRNYNVLFEAVELNDTKAQKEAFADTWSNVSYIDTLNEILELNKNIYDFLRALDKISTSKASVSYLTTMTIRIIYMHRLLKDTGSFYLHCDQTMSHYLKMICDFIFGWNNFQNEIIWLRTTNTGSSKSIANKFSSDTDTILYYVKSPKFVFNRIYKDYGKDYFGRFKFQDEKGYYRWQAMKTYSPDKLKELENTNRLRYSKNGKPEYKQYVETLRGVSLNNLWSDIFHINPMANERLGYPTQKPEALLERIINASSNEGDLVADFFCGCGTTIAVSQRLKRNWIGVDISHLAVKLMVNRLANSFGEPVNKTFEIFGFPKVIDSAKELAENTSGGRLKFEEWIVEVMLHGVLNENRTQMGYDGYFTFDVQGEKHIGMIEVKSGSATPNQLNHFIKTVESNNGHIGIFVCFEKQIKNSMLKIAKDEGYYSEAIFGNHYPKIQIISVENLLKGENIRVPVSTKTTFKTASKEIKQNNQGKLDLT